MFPSVVLEVAHRMGYLAKTLRPSSDVGLFPYDGNIIGGAMIGLGMATTGACPGTGVVQAGTGRATGILVAAGGVLGALVYLKLQPAIKRAGAKMQQRRAEQLKAAHGGKGPHVDRHASGSLAGLLGVHPSTMLLLWVPMCLGVMRAAFVFDRSSPQIRASGSVPPAYAGLLIGAAQAATVLVARHQLGTSAAYEDAARWIDGNILRRSSDASRRPPVLTPSVVFSLGIASAAAALNYLLLDRAATPPGSILSLDATTATTALAGGACMVFGARLAGGMTTPPEPPSPAGPFPPCSDDACLGCTSGHGISGLAKFSVSSAVTTAAMFGGGILVATLLGA